MDFIFNNLTIPDVLGCLNNIDNVLEETPNFPHDFGTDFGLFDEKPHNVYVHQQNCNTIPYQSNYQPKQEQTDCLYSKNLESNQSWFTIPSTQFHTQLNHSCTHEVNNKPAEFMGIREMKKEITEQLIFDNIPEKPLRRKPGRKKGQLSNVYHLWEFIRDLLKEPNNQNLITWEDRDKGIFRLIQSAEVAKLWGQKKNNKRLMNYEKMSRSLRYSRKEGYFMDIPRDGSYPKKLCFRFGPKSHGWK